MENIYLAKIKEDSTYTISRIMVSSKVQGSTGETVVFVYKSFEHMPNALGLVLFPAGSKSSFVSNNVYFFLDYKSAKAWVDERLAQTTLKDIDMESIVYVVDKNFKLSEHKVVEITKQYKASDDFYVTTFNIDNYSQSFTIARNNVNSTYMIESTDKDHFVLFSDIKEAAKYVKFNVQRKIDSLKKEYLAKMADYTDKLNKAETLVNNI